jgi:hypothetical protein
MNTSLFLELHRTHGEVLDREPVFFKLCIEHLGFLISEHRFEFECKHENWFADGNHTQAIFTNHNNQVAFYVIWDHSYLPILGVKPIERKFYERGLLPKFNCDEFNIRTARDDMEYNNRVENKIKLIGIWIRENLVKFYEA